MSWRDRPQYIRAPFLERQKTIREVLGDVRHDADERSELGGCGTPITARKQADRDGLGLPPWREGLDDSDDIGTDFTKLRKPDSLSDVAVDRVDPEGKVNEQLVRGGTDRPYSPYGNVWSEQSSRVELNVDFAPRVFRLCVRQGFDALAHDDQARQTKLVLVRVV